MISVREQTYQPLYRFCFKYTWTFRRLDVRAQMKCTCLDRERLLSVYYWAHYREIFDLRLANLITNSPLFFFFWKQSSSLPTPVLSSLHYITLPLAEPVSSAADESVMVSYPVLIKFQYIQKFLLLWPHPVQNNLHLLHIPMDSTACRVFLLHILLL